MASETDSNNLTAMERNIDQLIVLSEKLRSKIVPTVIEVLGKSNVDTREWLNAECDPKLLVLKTKLKDLGECVQQVQSENISAKEQVRDYKTKLDARKDLLSKAEVDRTKLKQKLVAAKGGEKALQEQLMKEVSLRKNAESSAASAKEQASKLEKKLESMRGPPKRKYDGDL
ncbi:hypothetical protein MKW98_020777 [Papaver atlanticum]|uniref:Uncharacterized protein n=1 Tax=Papaver atlanticum TaxID=357466 RepID=A0AAD4TIF9_9MAGN|nr:hypothetical protein MKW98_020777 [Papaver atlanticum]